MTAPELANIPIKLYGLLWMVDGFFGLGGLLMPGVERPMKLYSIVYSFAVFAGGVVLFLLSETIAVRLFRSDEQLAIGATATELLAASFGVIAVWLVARSLVGLVQNAYVLLRPANEMFGTTPMESLHDPVVQSVVGSVAQLIVGVLLFAGRDSLAKLWRRLRPMTATDQTTD